LLRLLYLPSFPPQCQAQNIHRCRRSRCPSSQPKGRNSRRCKRFRGLITLDQRRKTGLYRSVSRDTMKYVQGTGGGPGHRELWKKIEAARKLVANCDWIPVNPGHLDKNFRILEERFGTEWATEEDQIEIIKAALAEIRPCDYCGGDRPPLVSKELAAAGLPMWQFSWKSEQECFGRSAMYMKFSVQGTGEKGPLLIHSVHPDNPPSKE
jgi:hypothetical protein